MVVSVQYGAIVYRTPAIADFVLWHGHEMSELGRCGGREFAFRLIPTTSLPLNFHYKTMKSDTNVGGTSAAFSNSVVRMCRVALSSRLHALRVNSCRYHNM
jgi:hypothetical protein